MSRLLRWCVPDHALQWWFDPFADFNRLLRRVIESLDDEHGWLAQRTDAPTPRTDAPTS